MLTLHIYGTKFQKFIDAMQTSMSNIINNEHRTAHTGNHASLQTITVGTQHKMSVGALNAQNFSTYSITVTSKVQLCKKKS